MHVTECHQRFKPLKIAPPNLLPSASVLQSRLEIVLILTKRLTAAKPDGVGGLRAVP